MELVSHGGGVGEGLELADEFEVYGGVFFHISEPGGSVGGEVVGL